MTNEVAASGATPSEAQIVAPAELPPGSSRTQAMRRWEYSDGSVVRYKPLGDADRPGKPSFSIEVKKDPMLPDSGRGDAAFKVHRRGHAAPKTAHDLHNPFSNAPQADAFEDAAMQAVHFELKP